MLKRLIYLVLLIVSPLLAFSNTDAVAMLQKGYALYKKAQYKEAAATYQKMVSDGYQSTALYFNLGNAYYKTGDVPSALLYYEKAHKLSPGDEDVRFNIQLVNLKTTDKVEATPEFFISKWWHGFILAFSVNMLAIFSVILFLTGFLVLILYRFTNSVAVKKTAFFSAIVLLLLGAGTIFISGRQATYFDSHHEAIIFTSSVTVKSAPQASSKNLFVLHEGTKVAIMDENSSWMKIKLANGSEGWITNGDAKEI